MRPLSSCIRTRARALGPWEEVERAEGAISSGYLVCSTCVSNRVGNSESVRVLPTGARNPLLLGHLRGEL